MKQRLNFGLDSDTYTSTVSLSVTGTKATGDLPECGAACRARGTPRVWALLAPLPPPRSVPVVTTVITDSAHLLAL